MSEPQSIVPNFLEVYGTRYKWANHLVWHECESKDMTKAFMQHFNCKRAKILYIYSNLVTIRQVSHIQISNSYVLAHRLRQPVKAMAAHMAEFLGIEVRVNDFEEIEVVIDVDRVSDVGRKQIDASIVSFIQDYVLCYKCDYIGMVAFMINGRAILRCPNCPYWKVMGNATIIDYFTHGISCDDMDPVAAPIQTKLKRNTISTSSSFAGTFNHDNELIVSLLESNDDVLQLIYHKYDVIKIATHDDVEAQQLLLNTLCFKAFRHAITMNFVDVALTLYELGLVDDKVIADWCISRCRKDKTIAPFMYTLLRKYLADFDEF